MISQENIDRIESYLMGELSEEQETQLTADVEQDPELAAELDRRETAHGAMDFLIADNLKSQLVALEAKETKVVQMPRRRKLYPLAIAASLAIMVGAFFVFFPDQGSQDYAAQYYTLPDLAMRGTQAAQLPELIRKAQEDISNKDYQAALDKLAQTDSFTEHTLVARYYQGHAFYLSKDYTSARQAFADVGAGKDMRFVEDAQWYELLSCLEVDDSCVQELAKLLDNQQHPHHGQAEEIAKSLK